MTTAGRSIASRFSLEVLEPAVGREDPRGEQESRLDVLRRRSGRSDLGVVHASEWLAWRHALTYLYAADGTYPDAMLVVPATAPLREPSDLERCLDEYERGDIDVVITVTDAHRSPYFNMVSTGADGYSRLVIPPEDSVTRRQDVPVAFDMATVGYVANPAFVMRANGIFEGRVRSVHIPIERALDIDTLLDFRIAECLFDAQRETGG